MPDSSGNGAVLELTRRMGLETPYENQRRARAVAVANRNDWPYPWAYMPVDGRPFNRVGSVVSPAFDAANQVLVTGCEYTIPTGYAGVLGALWWEFVGSGFVRGSGDVVATVDVNTPVGVSVVGGFVLPDYGSMVVPLGAAATPYPVLGGWVLSEGDTVRLKAHTVATVGTGAPNFVVGGLQGWVWPLQGRHG